MPKEVIKEVHMGLSSGNAQDQFIKTRSEEDVEHRVKLARDPSLRQSELATALKTCEARARDYLA